MAKTSQEKIDKVMHRWTSGSGLIQDQQAKLLAVVSTRESELDQVRRQNSGKDQKETRQARMKEVRKKHRPNMQAVLNDEQAEQLKQQRKQWKAERSR